MKPSLIGLLLLISLSSFAADLMFGGNGATPAPINSVPIAMQSEHIVIVGKQLDTNNKKAAWYYSCDYRFKNNSTQPLHCKMALPFLVKNPGLQVSVPMGQHVNNGDPLLYDLEVLVNHQPVSSQQYTTTSSTNAPVDYKGAYLWDTAFSPKAKIYIHQDYSTGVSFNVLGQLLINYRLRPGSLWQGRIHSATIELRPNTPTRLCHELDNRYPKPRLAGMRVVGDKSQRQYIWQLEDFDSLQDFNLCLQTGKNYIRLRVVYPIATASASIHLDQMSLAELRFLRNTIFAQYGRVFTDTELQQYFDSQWWYEPNPNYSQDLLSADDRKALRFISAYEKQKAEKLE